MNRTEARERIMQLLYQMDIQGDYSREAKVDLAIARLALGEIFYMDAIPDAVAINEAVDLAKKYSTNESRRFINGILGQIVKKKDEPNSELDIGN